MTTTQPMTKTQDETYLGWTNLKTWNVALWLQNDEYLYELTREYDKYNDMVVLLTELEITETPDGVSYTDPDINTLELDTDVFDH